MISSSQTVPDAHGQVALHFYVTSRKLRRVNGRKTTEGAYTSSGVNIHLADTLKGGLKQKVRKTLRREVLGAIGGFGVLFALDLKKHKRPVLVSSMDGVGTKLKIAVALNKHDTVGQDLVNHCVNDIAVVGAEPLFFLDYIGMGELSPRVFNQVINGLVKACAEAGCALIGGETAQMPGMYSAGDYDLVSTIVGVVERDQMIDGSCIRPGDAIIGLASTGLHTNGYSLARQILFAQMRVRLDDYTSALGCTFGEELLKVHRNYWPIIQENSKFENRNPKRHSWNCAYHRRRIPRQYPTRVAEELRRGHSRRFLGRSANFQTAPGGRWRDG